MVVSCCIIAFHCCISLLHSRLQAAFQVLLPQHFLFIWYCLACCSLGWICQSHNQLTGMMQHQRFFKAARSQPADAAAQQVFRSQHGVKAFHYQQAATRPTHAAASQAQSTTDKSRNRTKEDLRDPIQIGASGTHSARVNVRTGRTGTALHSQLEKYSTCMEDLHRVTSGGIWL